MAPSFLLADSYFLSTGRGSNTDAAETRDFKPFFDG